MVSIQLAAIALAISGVSNATLLDFHATWCGPCRSMESTVSQISDAGYPVRKVDVDQEPGLAKRFSVTSIPCYVLIVDGAEVGRIVGAASAGELESLCAKGGVKPGQIARGQSPDAVKKRPLLDALRPKNLFAGNKSTPPESKLVPVKLETSAGPFPQPANARSAGPAVTPEDLLAVSVRLTIEDAQGFSHGTGTIIDSRQGEALILTCGHLFRDSQGKGKILIDTFGPAAQQKIPAQLISYDLTRDIGLVSIRTSSPVKVARVAPTGFQPNRGDKVFTVGCNHGEDPTVQETQVNSNNKFSGPKNVQVAGQPVQGRSGGGLFTTDGMVIGVCNAADPADNEGLYAAAETIQAQLDQSRLSDIYRNPRSQQPAITTVAAGAPALPAAMPAVQLDKNSSGIAGSRLFPEDRGNGARSSAATIAGDRIAAVQQAAAAAADNADAEVICIIRPLANRDAKSEIVVLNRASNTFLTQLAAERNVQDSRQLTSHDIPRQAPAPPIYTSQAAKNNFRR